MIHQNVIANVCAVAIIIMGAACCVEVRAWTSFNSNPLQLARRDAATRGDFRKNHHRMVTMKEQQEQQYELTLDENLMLFSGLPPSSTITWFQGNHERAAKVLRDRVALILEANPWLGGRIRIRNARVHLVHDQYPPPMMIDEIFQHHSTSTNSPLHHEMSLVDQVQTILDSNFIFPSGTDLRGPSWKVVVVPCSKSPNTHFGVIESMPHIVGDGYTFYAIQNMLLGADDKIRTLECRRLKTTKQLQENAMGKQDIKAFVSLGAVIRMVWGTVSSTAAKLTSNHENDDDNFRLMRRFIVVDNDKINQLKSDYAKKVSTGSDKEDMPRFISTNDIITSWFLSNNKCSQGMVAINLRNRLQGHTNVLAGNYESPLWLRCPDDTMEPSMIRQSVSTLKRAMTVHQPPSDWEMMTSSSFGIITNWSTFRRDNNNNNNNKNLNVQDCTQVMHVPIYGPEFFIPGTISHCCIFRYKPNLLAVAIIGTPSQLEGLAHAPFESDTERCD